MRTEQARIEDLDWQQYLIDREDMARARINGCDLCGSSDGMEAWCPATVADEMLEHEESCPKFPCDCPRTIFYRLKTEPDSLFTACAQCNWGEKVEDCYEPVSPEQIVAWLKKNGVA